MLLWRVVLVKVCTSVSDFHTCRRSWAKGVKVGFVPTMGALHRGHRFLLNQARRENDRVVLSVFVNPLQFGENEDFDRYPRNLVRDQEQARAEDVDLFFAPSAEELYRDSHATRVVVDRISEGLCGDSRPGHFDGVATVVFMLCQLVQPHSLYLGRKDAQQMAVIEQMVEDLHLPLRVRGIPTVRMKDGLALSSRNRYLTTEERRLVFCFYRSLKWAMVNVFDKGGFLARSDSHTVKDVEDFCRFVLMNSSLKELPSFTVEYVALRTYPGLEIPRDLFVRPLVCLAALWVGNTRLIDNIWVTRIGLRDMLE